MDFAKISLGVLIHIIVCEDVLNHSFDGFLLNTYIESLEAIGVVIKINNENCEECILTSQMIRLLAFRVSKVSKY